MPAILGKKIGMTRVFDEQGRMVPVTVVEAGPCVVVQRKTTATDGYEAVQVGFEDRKRERLNQPQLGHFQTRNVPPKRYLREFRVAADHEASPGDEILVMPKIQTKSIEIARGLTQILYQIAIAAKVALDL